MSRPHNRLADYAAYLAFRLVGALFHLFPVEMNLRTARFIGRIMWFIIGQDIPLFRKVLRRKHREQIMANLRLALGGRYTENELAQIGRASCLHLVMFAVEFLFTPRLITLGTWRRYVRLKNFRTALDLMLSSRGAILVAGHYGSWEVLGYTLACLGFDVVTVYRPLDNPYLNRYLTETRARKGLRLLSKKGAAEGIDEVLKDGSALAFIADQDAGRKGVFVEFFGTKASTYKSIALVAHQYQLPIIVGCARRTSWTRFEYELDVEEIIRPEDWRNHENEVVYITRRFNQAIERMVLADPRQYLWLHRRWKTRPKGEAEAPPVPA